METPTPPPPSQHVQITTTAALDLPPEPPSYEAHPPSSPAPAYTDHHHHPLRAQGPQRLSYHSHLDVLPGYVAIDQYEPPWTLPSANSIKYTVLAHQGAGEDEAGLASAAGHSPSQVGSGEGSANSNSTNDPLDLGPTFLHEVMAHQPSVPARRHARNHRGGRRRNSGQQEEEEDDDMQATLDSTAPVVFRRSSPWALEYWCEDTIMYLYFPVQKTSTQADQGSATPLFSISLPRFGRRGDQPSLASPPQEHEQQQQQQQQQEEQQEHQQQHVQEQQEHELTRPREHFSQPPCTAVPPPQLAGNEMDESQSLSSPRSLSRPNSQDLSPPSQPPPPPASGSVSTTIEIPTESQVSSSSRTTNPNTTPASPGTTTPSPPSLPTFALVTANDPLSSVWISRIDDTLIEESHQKSARDEVRLAWRARGGGTGDDKITSASLTVSCQHEFEVCSAFAQWGRRQRQRVTRRRQRQGGETLDALEQGQQGSSLSLSAKEQSKATKRRRQREQLEIMVRVRGQYFAWRDVTHEKLVGDHWGGQHDQTLANARSCVTTTTTTTTMATPPPLYQPRTMTASPPPPMEQQVEPSSGHLGIELTQAHRQSIPTAQPSPSPELLPPPAPPSSNGRMFALYRDDHFELDKKKKGYCVAEVWVVHEEEEEEDNQDPEAACPPSMTPHTVVAGHDTQLSSLIATTTTTANHNSLGGHHSDASLATFPDSLRRRKCMIRIKQGIQHDIETFILVTGPRLPDLFDRFPRRNPVSTGHAFIYAAIVVCTFIGWAVFFLSKHDGWFGPR